MKEITRRELLSSISKDAAKTVLGAWYGFKSGIDNETKPTGDEAVFESVRRLKKKPKFQNPNRKEGEK